MKKKRFNVSFIVMISLLTFLGILFGYLANSHPSSASEYTVDVILHDSESDEWRNLKSGMRAAARDYKIRLNILVTNAEDDSSKEIELINDAKSNNADGIIAEISDNSLEKKITTRLPAVYIENPLTDESGKQVYAIHNETAGETLLMRIVQNNSGHTPSIAIVNKYADMQRNKERLNGILKKAEENNITVMWSLSHADVSSDAIIKAQKNAPADILITLDNDSTEAAADAKSTSGFHGDIYGFGASAKCIYSTDTEVIKDLLVTDDYVMGYQAVQNLYNQLTANSVRADISINYRLVTKANLFTNKNQQILFPIS